MGKRTDKAEPTAADRAEYLCAQAEAAAMYLAGLADATEAATDKAGSMVSHLRHHANELLMGPMYVRNGYRSESRQSFSAKAVQPC